MSRFFRILFVTQKCWSHLIAVGNTSHTRHHTENVVIDSIDTNLSSGSSGNSGGRENKLKNGIVDSGEVAASTGLVLLGSKGKGIDVDAGVRVAGVVLEGLDDVEV